MSEFSLSCPLYIGYSLTFTNPKHLHYELWPDTRQYISILQIFLNKVHQISAVDWCWKQVSSLSLAHMHVKVHRDKHTLYPIIYDELCNHNGLNQKTYYKDDIWTKNDISLNLPALNTKNQSSIFLNIIASMQEDR